MSKDPAFLFYPNDWIGGTMGMTFEEKGAYMELLMMQFNRGHMTKHMIGQAVGQLWDNIQDKFEVDINGKYYNKRLEEEQIKRKRFTESRRNNIEGKNQHSKKGHKKGHTTKRMENVNEDENINKDIPTLDEFLTYAKTIEIYKPNLDYSIKAKYKTWVDDKWKDGNGVKIKNWKNKLANSLPYLKETNITSHNIPIF